MAEWRLYMNLEDRLKETEKLDLSKYELVAKEKLSDLNSAGLLLKHKKSGARVVVMTNDDDNKVFSIGFKTPAYNDTGLQHILEHSVLCGSRKYPVKDPFVELCKGSLNTFLNAMTYPDKTVYPVASCNLQDFKNIMDVYMDAVFYPDIYNKSEIFKQEGWHYELEDVDGKLEYNGVVYNEMKGVYSSPDDVLSRHIFVSLFPDTAYKYESGGEPSAITGLTYEEFLDYHKRYYHPVNSYIYLYGDFDVQERLDYLDSQYLCNFDKDEVSLDASIALQETFDNAVDAVYEYPITPDEQEENNTYLSVSKVVGTSTDRTLYLAMQILDYVLVLAPGARLKQALIDNNIGTDVYSILELSIYQPVYSIVAKNTDLDKKQQFLDTINSVLSDIVENGIDMRMVDAAINYFEFKYREADFGPYPKGLMYYLTMMDSWLYDEEKPFIHIESGDVFDELKEKKNNGYFEELIKKYLLNNNHCAVVSLVPKHNLEEERTKEEERRLEQYKASLSREELEEIVTQTKALKEYQDEPSSQEALKTIPMLTLDDIGKEPQKLYIDKKTVNGVDVIHHNIFTNKIAYLMLAFDCKNVPEELISYIGLLTTTLGLMDTENFTYTELTNEININCGGISTDATIFSDNRDFDKYSIMYEVKAKVLVDKLDFAFNMIKEILFSTKFDDYKRLKEIIARVKSRLESSMMNSGHTVAMLSGVAQFSPTGYYSDLLRGYKYYELIQKLDAEFDDLKEDIAAKLNSLTDLIFTKDVLKISYTTAASDYDKIVSPLTEFSKKLKISERKAAVRGFNSENVKKAYTSSSQVQYVARCGNFVKAGYKYTAVLKVLKVIFSYEYLWLNVRVKGGAYGCMSGFSRNGDTYMVSYRDPNLRKTNDIFEGAADYIREFNVSDRDMLKFIIGTIGDMDSPLTPSAKGIRSFGAYITNTDYEMLKRERMEVIEADVNKIRELAPLVEAALKQNYFCVVGNSKVIRDDAGMFDEIVPLYKNDK